MTGIHRMLASLIPGRRAEWLTAHGAELEVIDSGKARVRWTAGLVPLFTTALLSQLFHDPLSFLGGKLMRTVVATLSVMSTLIGIGLLSMWLFSEQPLGLLAFAGVLVVQGGFTLLLLTGWVGPMRDHARTIQLVGSTASVAVGLAGFAIGFLENIHPMNDDPEYAPMAVLFLIGVHGLASIATFVRQPPPAATSIV